MDSESTKATRAGIEELRAKLERLSPEARTALARRLEAARPSATPDPAPREAPLSFSQERIAFLEQLTPGTPFYHRPACLRLSGLLNATALEYAIDQLIRRHQVLRASFQARPHGLVQIVADHQPFRLQIQDAPTHPPEGAEAWLAAAATTAAREPFNLATGPLFRARLIRLGPADHALLLIFHHAVFDGWSSTILCEELGTHYGHSLSPTAVDASASLPDLPLQYGAWAARERLSQSRPEAGQRLSRLVQNLAGHPGTLALPLDFPRPATLSTHGDFVVRSLAPSLSRRLAPAARQHGVTVFMFAAAVVGTLLHRLCREDDLVLGVPVAGRLHPDAETLLGCFINTVALRLDFSGSPSTRVLLARVREQALHAFELQDIPFERLVSELNPPRDPGRTPVFQVLLQLRNLPRPARRWPGLEVSTLPVHSGTCKTDLSIDLTESGEGGNDSFVIQAEYNVSLFARPSIERWLAQVERLLGGMLDQPDTPVTELDLQAPSERGRLPDPSTPLPAPPVPHFRDVIRQSFLHSPEVPAVRQRHRTWTRGNFEAAVTALGQRIRLLTHPSPSRPVVAVAGSRSFGLLVALAAAVEAQTILLTLDSSTPLARRRQILADASAGLLVEVGASVLDAGAGTAGLPRLGLDPDTGLETLPTTLHSRSEATQGDTDRDLADPLPAPKPDAPAYLFFTSGTTGSPKAILGRTRGLDHFLNWQCAEFGIGPHDRAAQLTNLGFDVILRDVFAPLVGGACLHLPVDGEDNAPDQVIAWLARERITVVHVVPSLADAWLDAAPEDLRLPELRLAFFAGESLLDTLVERWRRVAPSCRIINLYGPTETTLAKCFHEVSHPPLPGVQPIGRSLPQTQVLVLTDGRNLCGVGEPGQIAIRTPFRSLGYLHDPAGNLARFVPNPWRSDPDDLLYLTGDLGRFRPDGSIDILGRTDYQVKIRGVRIEPAEVSRALSRLPGVRACTVIAHSPREGQKQLVAFVVPLPEAAATEALPSAWSSRLRELLPVSHLQECFILLSELPLTPNGKIDHAALLRRAREHAIPTSDSPAAHDFPDSALGRFQRAIAELWSEVLPGRTFLPDSDFFELGGHSQLALQIVQRLRGRLGMSTSLADFFRHPTVAGLAVHSRPDLADHALPTPSLLLGARHGVPLFFVPGYFGIGTLRPSLVAALRDTVPYFDRLKYAGVDDDSTPASDMAGIVEPLLAQIHEVHPPSAGPLCLAGFSYGGTVAFEVARRLRLGGREVPLLLLYDSRLWTDFRKRSRFELVRELVRRLARLPPDRRGPFVTQMLRAKLPFFHPHPAKDPVGDDNPVPLAGIPERAAPALIHSGMLKQSVRLACRRAIESYVPLPYAGRVALFKATEMVPNEWLRHEQPECNGWSRVVTGPLEIIPVPRDHLGVFTEPLHPELLQHTVRLLRKIRP